MLDSTRRVLQAFFVVAMTAGFATVASPAGAEDWKSFRLAHPYHIQTLAISEPDLEGHRLLILTEPPPHVTIQGVRSIAPSLEQAQVQVKRHRIGFDGWVQDVLIDLPPIIDTELNELLDEIQHYLFATSYKSTVIPLTAPTVPAASGSLDLRVSADDLQRWLIGDGSVSQEVTPNANGRNGRSIVTWALFLLLIWNAGRFAFRRRRLNAVVSAGCLIGLLIVFSTGGSGKDSTLPVTPGVVRFTPIGGGEPMALRSVLQGPAGVFFSEEPGLVLWTFNRNVPLDEFKVEARVFTLDTDLILGAVALGHQIAVVGRERVVPLETLPPLRTETILLLASAGTEELAQSYERNHLFAGKFDREAGRDWAPIYLSPELIDTEYGSLLNITDQLLKSWSMNGQVRYVNFDYPDPDKWPFPKPLAEHTKSSEITFNWNTKGAGYSLTEYPFEVYALNRTGALPVDYLARDNEKLIEAEDKGYEYFGTRNDANLVRVVQYASLYQIFRRFQVTANPPEPLPNQISLDELRPVAKLVATQVADLDDEFFRLNPEELSEEDLGIAQELEELRGFRDDLSQFIKETGTGGLDALANCMLVPRGCVQDSTLAKLRGLPSPGDQEQVLAALPESEQIRILAYFHAQTMASHAQIIQALLGLPLGNLLKLYVNASQRSTHGWVHTPSIVVSTPIGSSAETIGGHNLDSKISLFRESTEVTPGQILVREEAGQKFFLYNRSDSTKLGSLIRTAGREQQLSAYELEARLADRLRSATTHESLPMARVLGFSDELRPAPARGFQAQSEMRTLEKIGYQVGTGQVGKKQREVLEVIAGSNQAGIVIERAATGEYTILQGAGRQFIDAGNAASAQDATILCVRMLERQGKQPVLYLRGFEARQGEGFLKSMEAKMGKPSMTAFVDETRMEAGPLRRLLTEEFDFKRVTIGELRVTETAERVVLESTLNVAAKVASRPSLLVRIRLLFGRGVELSQSTIRSIMATVQKWVEKLSNTATFDWATEHMLMLRELQQIHPGVKLEFQLTREAKDILIVQDRDSRSETGEADRAA